LTIKKIENLISREIKDNLIESAKFNQKTYILE